MSSDISSDDDLLRSAQRVARLSGSMAAGLIQIWERAFPQEKLTTSLGCSERAVLELALCLRPRAEAWVTDVAEIAGAVGIESAQLELFFRSAEVLERLSLAHPVNESVGQLMAARDRDEDD
jgi:hypothetical protein